MLRLVYWGLCPKPPETENKKDVNHRKVKRGLRGKTKRKVKKRERKGRSGICRSAAVVFISAQIDTF